MVSTWLSTGRTNFYMLFTGLSTLSTGYISTKLAEKPIITIT